MQRTVAVIQMRGDDGMNKANDSANGTQGTDAGLAVELRVGQLNKQWD